MLSCKSCKTLFVDEHSKWVAWRHGDVDSQIEFEAVNNERLVQKKTEDLEEIWLQVTPEIGLEAELTLDT